MAQISPSAVDQWAQKVGPWVFDSSATTSNAYTKFVIFLNEQADLSAAASLKTKLEKGRFVYHKLTETARQTQTPILAGLAAQGVMPQPFWVANMIWVRGDLSLAQCMATRADVRRVCANPTVRVPEPTVPATPSQFRTAAGAGVGSPRNTAKGIHSAAPSYLARSDASKQPQAKSIRKSSIKYGPNSSPLRET